MKKMILISTIIVYIVANTITAGVSVVNIEKSKFNQQLKTIGVDAPIAKF